MRGSKDNYDDWEKMGNSGWSFKNVLPYFIKSEDNFEINDMDKGYHGVGGPLPVGKFPYYSPISEDILQAGRELGISLLNKFSLNTFFLNKFFFNFVLNQFFFLIHILFGINFLLK